ncbi:MAG: HAD-IC family P-type ATPase [Ilumatobacteraceae bacterium]|nr:HAD-IC family P-type ATPase [Ilumatobacteraceae bacterium]
MLHSLNSSANGLSSLEATDRLASFGPNRLAETPPVPAWKRFVAQFSNLLTIILIAAAVISLVVAREVKTPAVVFVVVLMNAIIGFVQENKAEASLAALRRMLASSARVKRDGAWVNVDTANIVPGDVVLVEAGDRIPADGRLLTATNLEIEEAALTGESLAVAKTLDDAAEDAALGDRKCMAFMNTTVTRGRGEYVVTATGMNTEMGKIAGLLASTESDKSPLQKQLDTLAHSLAKLAGVIVALVFIIGLISGDSLSDLFLTAVALAVAAIPEGLPAVTAVTLAIGVTRMAKYNAIVKRLASVETLGCTSVICSDKTGTLTLNQMTARELVFMETSHKVSGEGYSPEGRIVPEKGDDPIVLISALMPMALCNDAVVNNNNGEWELVGDPTEGALTVLAMKGGIDPADLQASRPRIAEIPFDSAHKFMATFHQMVTDEGRDVVRLYVKGAPDVLLNFATRVIDKTGAAVDISSHYGGLLAHNSRLASEGLRVLAVAQRDFDLESWQELSDEDPMSLVQDLTFLALVGIIDPPRPEARDAIAIAHSAGISVKMITGDHAVTAAAIGANLGLHGNVVTDLEKLSEDELDKMIDATTVFARVSPSHKIRLVTSLQRKGNVVAMTGDGVNDAPALKKADIGVAMGITGTEVTKEAATMVLTDDNFATIVRAVERGRTIYDNIVKFVRFQLSTTLGFAAVFLLASLLDIASRKPFTAIAILWVNIIMDGPPAMALGVDRAAPGVMDRAPRPADEPILTRRRWSAIGLAAVVMAIGTLAVFVWAPGPEAEAGVASVAGTMGFNTFVLFQFFNILNVRSENTSVFSRMLFSNKSLWISLVSVLLLQIGVTHLGFMQSLFETTSLSATEWAVCVAVASSILWVEEIRKLVSRIINK